LENADDFDDDDYHMLFSELALLKQFNHQNILSLIDCFSHETQIWCIYPLMHYGTLTDILNSDKREKGLSESAMQIISKSVLSALQYIHAKYIIHRCVCPENIYVTKNGDVLLGGFNFSVTLMNRGSLTRKLFDYPPKIRKYLNYLSPEVLQQVRSYKYK
jgi:serine/threonine protein kinase